MAKLSREAKSGQSPNPAWISLTWDDLENAFGSSVERGRAYQRGGHVQNLCISPEGELLASVRGTERYATTVALKTEAGQPSFESNCTCPIGGHCKHVVAVIAEYLTAIAKSQPVPTASANDPRWAALENTPSVTGGDWDDEYEDDEYWDEDDDENEEEEDFEPAPQSRRRSTPATPASQPTSVNWQEKIEEDIRARTQTDLADLVCSLIRRFPELEREFRERLVLQKGNVSQLASEARKQIRKVTEERGWSNHWSDEGHTPDYTPIRHRLERMLELGHADEVVSLGRELIERGLQQIGESNDEGETAEAFRECLPVVFQALARSRLSGPERLLFVIDALLEDDYDTFNDVSDTILDSANPKDWSAVADTLIKRLKAESTPSSQTDDFSGRYHRDGLTDWIATALAEAGREAELRTLYESEARITGSYERLVTFLQKEGRTEDAERWAKEGIAATQEKWPGIATRLIEDLGEVARQRQQWDVVAAHAADKFFNQPSEPTFDALIEAARQAKVEDAVREAALHFLETGVQPYRVAIPKPAASAPRTPKQSKAAGKKSAKSQQSAPASPPPASGELTIEKTWPLPVPEYLRPTEQPRNQYDRSPRPRLNVLLDMAISANKPDEVLHWYDKMRSAKQGTHEYYRAPQYADQVAAAVATAYPERSLEIYRAGLDAQLPHADPTAYANAAGYLRKLRPIYESLGRLTEWTALVNSIREKYKNRPRFMEQLDNLDGRTIVEAVRKSRKG